jgi:hypothetical protein
MVHYCLKGIKLKSFSFNIFIDTMGKFYNFDVVYLTKLNFITFDLNNF